MRKGWFKIKDVQDGVRTLDEQLKGLAPALAEASGKRVLDLGCAEGLIAREFARASAAEVVGIECNLESVEVARQECAGLCRIECSQLGFEPLPAGPWDIVLALSILHKLRNPAAFVADIAALAPALVVVRLPGGSEGVIVTKNYLTRCNLNKTFKRKGFQLEHVLVGARGERVQYWRPALNGATT